jgi:hypothetical protein
MGEYRIDGWTLEYDSDLTRLAYSRSGRGAHECQCLSCRNYVTIRDDFYPASFLQMLDEFGINKHKEAEVYEFARQGSGLQYGGWYHFIGRLREDPDRFLLFRGGHVESPVWQIYFHQPLALALETFGSLELVQLEFIVELPWWLAEPPSYVLASSVTDTCFRAPPLPTKNLPHS